MNHAIVLDYANPDLNGRLLFDVTADMGGQRLHSKRFDISDPNARENFATEVQAAAGPDVATVDIVEQLARHVAKVRAPASGAVEKYSDGYPLTDHGNGERLVYRHGNLFRFVARWPKPVMHVGTHWRLDETGDVDRLAVETVRALKREAARIDDQKHAQAVFMHACRSEGNKKIRDMLERARNVEGACILPEQLDPDPWLFNVNNGTLDLRTFQLRCHRPEDFISKLCPIVYNPSLTCPTFLGFLDRIFDGNERLMGFVQRMIGYTLTGITSERVLFIFYGNGANGKSTLLGVLRDMLGDYASQVPAAALMQKKHGDGIPNDIARLKGARCVAAMESDEGQRIAESMVKQMTGGEDLLSARFMRGEWFEFKPEFKLYLATNHRPEIRGTDAAIWDRIRLIPFNVRIPEQDRDKNLSDKLRGELAGILAWAVEGCRQWQRDGLGAPEEVRQATENYREDMDRLGDFIGESCEVGAGLEVGATVLFETYKAWCVFNSETVLNQTRFGRRMEEKGFPSGKDSTGRKTRCGIDVRRSDFVP